MARRRTELPPTAAGIMVYYRDEKSPEIIKPIHVVLIAVGIAVFEILLHLI